MKMIFSMKMAVIMLFLFGIIAGTATFIENDYGTQTAQALIYKARWFEIFLAYFTAILVYNIIKYKSYKTRPAVFLFHISFLVIAIGAAVTRYVGYEGIMHIREGSMNNMMVSDVKMLQVQATKGKDKQFYEKELYFSSMTSNSLDTSLSIDGKDVHVELEEYLPTAKKVAVASSDGVKLLELKISTGSRGEIYYLKKGAGLDFDTFSIGYDVKGDGVKPHILIVEDKDGYRFKSPFELDTLNMDTKELGQLSSGFNNLQQRHLYRFLTNAIVLKDIHKKSVVSFVSDDIKTQRGKSEYMKWKVSIGEKSKIVVTRPYKGQTGDIKKVTLDGIQVELRVGAKQIEVPFFIQLDDFELERYPGSMTPASYASDVVLIDKEQNINMPYRIYMNHILDHRSYRFFQSSYDQDEKGTILSVNHDPGTLPTYIGYLLLTIGMIWSLFAPSGRFQKLLKGARKLQTTMALVFGVLFALSNFGHLEASSKLDSKTYDKIHAYDLAHSENFGKLVVQDYQGRMKPMDTVAHEIISKITGKTNLFSLQPNQMLLGMIMEPSLYQTIPMIKIGHKKIALDLGLNESDKYAKFSDFFSTKTNEYKIFKQVTEASKKKPLEKTQYDKELLKIDERLNVSYMTYQGAVLTIFPKPNDTSNKWMAPLDAIKTFSEKDSQMVKLSISAYFQMVSEGVKSGKWKNANLGLKGIKIYQKKYGSDVMPSSSHIDMEIKYNKFGLFGKLVPLYLLIGLSLLVFAFINVIKPSFSIKWAMYISLGALSIGFTLHVIGLLIRWYIAGHAPWANAYESIVFIALSTVFAGLLLARKSPFALAATAILAGVTMGVAHMSFINPEITNLVPVLKSYWLMIHVATIISGDGFLGLGSILSLLVLVLYIMRTKDNQNIDRAIKELTNLSEVALIIGLFLLTIGNFLGGVWANESWGRYWGWDAKETWAAVSILIYATVLHLRFIPLLSSKFTYNLASTWAYSSVLMTYFGVNYYLSGLHSYAAGDPVPMPLWVYYAVAVLFTLSILAYRKRDKKL